MKRSLRQKWARKLLWVVPALYAAVVFVWIGQDRRLATDVFEKYSISNTSPLGLSLAHGYLKERGAADGVRKLTRMIDHATLESDAVVLRIGPQYPTISRPPDPESFIQIRKLPPPPAAPVDGTRPVLTAGEEEWVRSGGRLVMAVDQDYGPLQVSVAVKGEKPKKAFPVWPGVESLTPMQDRILNSPILARGHSLITVADAAMACRIPMDRGELILLSIPEIFQNRNIATGDHLKLLQALVGAGRTVHFDEFVHNVRSNLGTMELLARWGFGPLVLLIAAVCGLLFWRNRATIGPPEDDYKETRSEAIDFVDSLAQLYGRALQRKQAIALYHKDLVQSVSAQSGLRGEELKKKLRELTPGFNEGMLVRPKDITHAEFHVYLRILNEAYRRLEHGKRR
jgi:hypothetical protein